MDGPSDGLFSMLTYYPVPTTIQYFASAAHSVAEPTVTDLPDTEDDGTSVRIHTYTDCDPGIEIMLVEIIGGGHQWPMRPLPFRYLGNATYEIDANEMMCCFFQRHSLCGCDCDPCEDAQPSEWSPLPDYDYDQPASLDSN